MSRIVLQKLNYGNVRNQGSLTINLLKNAQKMKKAQLKIQQMAFMLVAVFLFFVLAGLFYLMLQYRSMHQEATTLEENKATLIAETLANYPEFSCAKESYCIDADKLINFDSAQYKGFFPVSYIKLRKIPFENENKCNTGNYPNCNYFEVYKGKESEKVSSAGSFVALCRWEKIEGYAERVCELGRISIGYNIK